jgi:hypothetical protein
VLEAVEPPDAPQAALAVGSPGGDEQGGAEYQDRT